MRQPAVTGQSRPGDGASQLDDPQGARREVPVIIDSVLRAGEGKLLRKLKRIAEQVNSIEEDFAALSDAELRSLTDGAALHMGNIAEMKTGEGKTLTGVLPAYLNALTGNGVHLVTINDYLAKRDSEWMGRVHRFLGLEV